VGSESFTYDNLGRVTQVQKVISSTAYTTSYVYNLAGELTALTYPSGRVVTQAYDVAGRLSSISSGATQYVNTFQYDVASGLVNSFKYGSNAVDATFSYSADRLQFASLSYKKVGDSNPFFHLSYGYGSAGSNNGQIMSISDTVENGRSVSYTYDALHRLKTAVTSGSAGYPQWGLSWTYDRYGNRTAQTVTHGTGPSNSVSIDAATNRITGAPYAYDANGNLTQDGLNAMTYDAENRVVSAAGATYSYDGAGLRVKKVLSSNTTVYVFSGSKVLAEYLNGSLSKEYVYSGSALIAVHDAGTLKFQMSDHLSLRVATDASGTMTATTAHFPYGENWYETGGANKLKFTSYERDSESGNDYAIFRFQISRLGRFNRPDPVAGSIADPQTLNRYLYVSGDPINLIDPLGLQQRGYGAFNQRMCLVDGQSVPCSVAHSIIGMDAIKGFQHCPGGICPTVIQQDGKLYQRVPAERWKAENKEICIDGVCEAGIKVSSELFWELHPVAEPSWWGTFFTTALSWESFGESQQDAWDKGYYSCIGSELWRGGAWKGPIVSHSIQIAAELAVSHTRLPQMVAGAYYHLTDRRFTAWGKYSQVLVPKAAQAIRTGARAVGVAGWSVFYYETAAAIGTCAAKL
jgi:RHS repeat-associated protein